jgi:exosortase/archaeosortase family protein
MVSLFFGEFHRLGWPTRGLLMASSFAVAFIVNFGRTMLLTYLGGVGGNDLMERWHDTIGNAAMVLCLVALWLLAEFFQRRRPRPAAAAAAPPAPSRTAPFPLWFAALGLLWLAGSEVATAAWYRAHEGGTSAPIEWNVAWPKTVAEFHPDTFPDRTRALLKYNEGQTASWRTPEGYRWQMYYLRWLPGRISKFLAGAHYPSVCLPANGLKLVAETGPFVCRVGDLSIPFTTYLFDNDGQDIHVFHAIVEDNPAAYRNRIVYRQANSTERLRSVLRGERNLGERVLGIALAGPLDAADARAAVNAMLNQIVVIETPPSVASTQPRR